MKRRAIPWVTGYYTRKLFIFTTMLPLATFSCDKKELEPPLNCGCDSDSIGYVKDVLGSYRGGGRFNLFDSAEYNRFLSAGMCDIDTTLLELSPSAFTFNYKVSGIVKERCPLFPGQSPPIIPGAQISKPTFIKLTTPYQL